MINTAVSNQQSRLPIDEARLVRAAGLVLGDAEYREGEISIAVVDDPTIHKLNARHLNHDYPTDVLSFPLLDAPPCVEGEVIVSADTAIENAARYGWPAESELCLYVVHGLLHLAGYGDKTDDDRREMRAAEAGVLTRLGVSLPEAKEAAP
ncbi:MAG: rRNA maturation RNase YbeY [Planctomycetota bacterium]